MRIARIGYTEIFINPYLVLLIVLWLLAGLPVESILLFTVVLVHELVHVWVAWLHGLKVDRVELYPFGGLAKLREPPEWYPHKEIAVAVAGPLFNLVLAGAFYFFLLDDIPHFLQQHAFFFIRANLVLACFNLLPALPLDGGRVYRAVLVTRSDHRRATEAATRLGKVFGVLLFILGLALFSYDYLNLSISLIGIFLYNAAQREREKAIYAFLRYLSRKEKELYKKGVIVGRTLIAYEDTTLNQVLRDFRPQHYHLIWVLDRSCRVKRWLSETEILEKAWKKGIHLPLKKV